MWLRTAQMTEWFCCDCGELILETAAISTRQGDLVISFGEGIDLICPSCFSRALTEAAGEISATETAYKRRTK